MQYLVMPFTRCMMLCGYKNPEYTKYWGYPHYGVDISTIQGGASDDHRILASAKGWCWPPERIPAWVMGRRYCTTMLLTIKPERSSAWWDGICT